MDSFTILILILLILSIANNLIMYQKCYISRNLPTFDSKLNSSIGFFPINFYYVMKSDDYSILDKLKELLGQYQNTNKSECFVTYENPSFDDYLKINSLQNNVQQQNKEN